MTEEYFFDTNWFSFKGNNEDVTNVICDVTSSYVRRG